MVLVRKHVRFFALLCLLVFCFVFLAQASSAAAIRAALKKAWDVLRQILSGIGILDRAIQMLFPSIESLKQEIERLTNRKAFYSPYLSNLRGQLTTEVSTMRQKEGELKTARKNGDKRRVNRLTGEIKRLQRRINVIRYTIDSIAYQIRSIDRQLSSKRAALRAKEAEKRRKEEEKRRKQREADRVREQIEDLQEQLRQYEDN